MPLVSSLVPLKGVTAHDIWPILRDFGTYPTFMTDVLQVDVLENSVDTIVSRWRVLLNGSELTWTEKDVLVENVSITFEQIDGDLEAWHGAWRIVPTSECLIVRLDVVFDIGIPSLAEILDPIGIRAVKANSRQMLDAIGSRMCVCGK
jgi:ribosome-associated toxin RatA of RatAB toxin-antitoxin module